MKAYDYNNKKNHDNRGGMSMQAHTLKIKLAEEDIKYLQNVVKTTHFELARFAKASQEEKQILIGNAFSRKLLEILKNEVGEYSEYSIGFRLSNSNIKFYRKVVVVVKGDKEKKIREKDKKGKEVIRYELQPVEKSFTVTTSPGIIGNFYFSNNYLTCTLYTDQNEWSENTVIARAIKENKNILDNFKNIHSYSIVETLEGATYWENLIKIMAQNMAKAEVNASDILRHLFDTLNYEKLSVYPGERPTRLSNMKGIEAVYMSQIYNNANKHYPLFERLSFLEKMDVLNQAFVKAKRMVGSRMDIYLLSMTTFECLTERNLIKIVEFTCRRIHLLKKHYRNGRIKWLQYSHSVKDITLLEGFQANDLWLLLSGHKVKSKLDSDRVVS